MKSEWYGHYSNPGTGHFERGKINKLKTQFERTFSSPYIPPVEPPRPLESYSSGEQAQIQRRQMKRISRTGK